MNAVVNVEQMLIEEIAKCHDDPLRYVMLAFPWGVKGTALEKQTGPDTWQVEQLNSIRDHIRSGKEIALRDCTASGHGIGKSAETAWIILWFMSTRPHCAGVVTANTMPQLKSKTWRELSLWHNRAINKHWFEWTATRFYSKEHPSTWGIDAIAWTENNSESFAGLHAEHVLVVYDEASNIADIIWEVTEGAMTTPGAFWFAFGNPTRNTGRFRECFRANRKYWNSRQVDSRTCKMTNKQEIENWSIQYGEDSDFMRVRVKGEFPRVSSNQLISAELVQEAAQRVLHEPAYNRYPILVGVDVARFGDDSSVIIPRQGSKVYMPIAYQGINTMSLAANVVLVMNKIGADCALVDGIGVGAGVVDRLKQLGVNVIDVQSAATALDSRMYANKRAELWGRMSEAMAELSLPDCKELQEELSWPQYGYDGNLRIQIESTQDIKKREGRSPDYASALAMTFEDGDKIALAMGGQRNTLARPVKQGGLSAWT